MQGMKTALLVAVFLSGLKPHAMVMITDVHTGQAITLFAVDVRGRECTATPLPNPLATDEKGFTSFCLASKAYLIETFPRQGENAKP
jgi:hypothetical protein